MLVSRCGRIVNVNPIITYYTLLWFNKVKVLYLCVAEIAVYSVLYLSVECVYEFRFRFGALNVVGLLGSLHLELLFTNKALCSL